MGPADRRGFLRGLTTLPLLGGSIALIGQPTAADVPVTHELRDRYIAWLANEHAAALFERDSDCYRLGPDSVRMCSDWHFARVRMPMSWFPTAPDIERSTAYSLPSGRAALVLSAVGLDRRAA